MSRKGPSRRARWRSGGARVTGAASHWQPGCGSSAMNAFMHPPHWMHAQRAPAPDQKPLFALRAPRIPEYSRRGRFEPSYKIRFATSLLRQRRGYPWDRGCRAVGLEAPATPRPRCVLHNAAGECTSGLCTTWLSYEVRGDQRNGALDADLTSKTGLGVRRMREALPGGFTLSKNPEVHDERLILRTMESGFRIDLHPQNLNFSLSRCMRDCVSLPFATAPRKMFNVFRATEGNGWDRFAMASLGAFREPRHRLNP